MDIIFLYPIMAYGLTVLLVEGIGPFHILEKFRDVMKNIHPMFGEMLECFLCTSTNIGWIVILVEYMFDCILSPVTAYFGGPCVIGAFYNMFFTCGIVWILRNIITLLEVKIDEIDSKEEDDTE